MLKFAAFSMALSLFAATPVASNATDQEDSLDPPKKLADFSAEDRSEWRAVNDGVMGGISQSSMERTDRESGLFSGRLSLENNGGFASVRTNLGRQDLSGYAGLEIRARGDGRSYQLRLRTDDGFDGIAYRARFETRASKWMTVRLPFGDFVPTFRGRELLDVPPLDRASVRQLAFMLADGQPGEFSLEIDYVQTWVDAAGDSENSSQD